CSRLISSTAPAWSRTVPVKLTMAPISVRPCVRRAISAPISKSSSWRRITSASGHRREESDLARVAENRTAAHAALVDGGADHLVPREGIGEFGAARLEPGDQLADCSDLGRERDLLGALADLLFDPGEIKEPRHRISPHPS